MHTLVGKKRTLFWTGQFANGLVGADTREKSMKFKLIARVAALLILAQPVAAADFSDPTWPCIQRKVVTLSVGQMFPFVIPELPEDAKDTKREITSLAQRLSVRKFSIEEVTPWINAFAQKHPSNAALGALFTETFSLITKRRSAIINGIGRYAGKQSALSDLIEAQRREMRTLLDATEPDYDKIDAIEERLDWDERIYQDRVRALTYVCESPVLLEKRAFAIAKLVQNHWAQ